MKKYYTVLFMVIPLCLLLSCTASTNGIEFAVDYNNTAQAEDIVSNIYNSNMIDDLVDSESLPSILRLNVFVPRKNMSNHTCRM